MRTVTYVVAGDICFRESGFLCKTLSLFTCNGVNKKKQEAEVQVVDKERGRHDRLVCAGRQSQLKIAQREIDEIILTPTVDLQKSKDF